MKSIILIVAAVMAIAAAAPTENHPVRILSQSLEQQPDGSYTFEYETDDGSSRRETGVVREVLNEKNELQRVIIVSGTYAYVNNEGEIETINYSGDEGGFHAEGASIPKA